MENPFKKIWRAAKKPRQEWEPHWALKILYGLWMTFFSVFKIALGAAITVLLIVLICGGVFLAILGDYLQNDVLPVASTYELNISDQEQTSYIYIVHTIVYYRLAAVINGVI